MQRLCNTCLTKIDLKLRFFVELSYKSAMTNLAKTVTKTSIAICDVVVAAVVVVDADEDDAEWH